MIRSLLLASLLVAASMSNVAPAVADVKGDTVGSALRALQGTKARGGDVKRAGADALLDVTRNERVMVDVFVTGSLPDAVAGLEVNGMQVLATSERPLPVVSGRLGLVRLDPVAALDFVRGIQPVVGGGTDDWPGTKGTQGDTAHRGPAARALGGGNPLVRGKGVKVGIISDTIDSVGGGIADSVASGNLPAGRVVSLQEDPDPFVVDEGRAMAEIVYDTVPGVEQIVFSSGTVSAAGKAASINALVNQGVKVIGDDIFWLTEPFFQDGQVAQAVNNARAAGVTYFASAGNRARQSWEGTYTDSGGFHNFAGGDTTQSVVSVPPGRSIALALQWNEPWGAATTDIDAFLTKPDGTALPGATSGGGDDNLSGAKLPSEFVSWSNGTQDEVTVALRIQRFAGSGTPMMKYIALGVGTFTIAEHATNSDTINPDAASAPGSIAVAAVDAADPGLDTVQAYSSRGLKTRLRDKNGVALPQPLVLQKPQLAAADGIATSVPEFEKFFGTSAAVPSAVGIAALMLWARPTLTPAQIEAIMTDPTRSTNCLPSGARPNAECGGGFVFADSSLQALDSTGPTVVANVTGRSGDNGWRTGDAAVEWAVTDPESVITASCQTVVITADTTGTTRDCEAASIGGISRASVTVKRDSTPPLPPTFTGVVAGSFTPASLPPTEAIGCTATDATSGLAGCTVVGYSSQPGTHTLTATATDNAGLQSVSTLTYEVVGQSLASPQSVKAPPKKLTRGTKRRLAKTTRQGSSLRWKALTKKTCVVKKGKLNGKRKGTCRVRATGPVVPGYAAFSKRYTIRIR
ncbi:MAG: S8 family serine peptidase [Candidatus Nanopelagicales bacterium]